MPVLIAVVEIHRLRGGHISYSTSSTARDELSRRRIDRIKPFRAIEKGCFTHKRYQAFYNSRLASLASAESSIRRIIAAAGIMKLEHRGTIGVELAATGRTPADSKIFAHSNRDDCVKSRSGGLIYYR